MVSAFYDITHGVGLAILTPAWMKHVLNENTKLRFARFAREVFGVEDVDDMEAAKQGIEEVKYFFKSLGMPQTLSEAGVDSKQFDKMAAEAVRTSGLSKRSYVKLEEDDVKNIFELCK